MKNILFLLTLFTSSILFAQSPIPFSLEKYRTDFIPEKVFVHTDKNIYAGGEVIWMAVYLVDGQTHLSGTPSKAIKVELRDIEGKVISHKNLFSDQGNAACDITIPSSTPSGNYQLVAYTNYQKNTGLDNLFRKTIRIIPGIQPAKNVAPPKKSLATYGKTTKPKPNIQFFPEGGDCVDGVPCQVAYTVENIKISSQKIFGHLVDRKGKELLEIKPNKYGIGKFTYLPNKGEKFWIKIDRPTKRIQLPIALENGYHLNVRNEKDTAKILVKTKLAIGVKGTRLVLHSRGQLLLDQKLKADQTFAWIKIPKNNIPAGVVTCTLFDFQKSPVAERLFFVAPPAGETKILIEADTSVFNTREDAQLKINTSNNNVLTDNLAGSKISLSIIPTQANNQTDGDDIRTWLLLNSDLDISIPFAPELLFDKEAGSQDQLIDEFLMTRGWRRFRWEKVLANENFVPEFPLEQGIYLKGKMSKYENINRDRPGKVFLTHPESAHSEEVMTDMKGDFSFGPFEVFDTTAVYIEGRFKLGRKNRLNPKINIDNNPYVKLQINDPDFPEIPFKVPFKTNESFDAIKKYMDLSQDMLTISRNYDSLSIVLDEIEIEGKRISSIEKERRERTLFYLIPNNRLVVDSVPGARSAQSLFDLLRRLPGVTVSGGFGFEQVVIRGVGTLTGSTTPLYLLDGFPVDDEFFRGFPVSDIEFVDLLKGPRTAIYGSRAKNGVILVYSKKGSRYSGSNKPVPGLLHTKIIGFHKAREFAVFDPNAVGNSNRPDIRTTLHWNPDLRTDAKGEVWEAFKTSDQIGNFIIIAQGLRKDGLPIFGTASFRVEE